MREYVSVNDCFGLKHYKLKGTTVIPCHKLLMSDKANNYVVFHKFGMRLQKKWVHMIHCNLIIH